MESIQAASHQSHSSYSDNMERSQAEALNPAIASEYFEPFHKTLESNGLTNSPRQIYKCDETILPLDCSREKVLTFKGAKDMYRQTHDTTDHITLLCCGSALEYHTHP